MNLFPKLPIKYYVVVGSYAMGTRYAKDIDVICYKKDVEVEFNDNDYISSIQVDGRRIELLFADNQESLQQVLKLYEKEGSCFAETHVLYALKKGHIYFPHKQWRKHIHDLHTLKAIAPYSERHPFISELITLHRKCTEERIGRLKTPKFNGVSKDDFFDNYVKKFYEHDDIHQVMAHKERPMYTYMQRNPSSVECSKDLWDKFTDQEKIWCVLEEAYVIALERHIIPTMTGKEIRLNNQQAFEWALMRICTNLCSGFFRAFAVDNYFRIYNSYNSKFVDKFMKHVEQGDIQAKIGNLVSQD